MQSRVNVHLRILIHSDEQSASAVCEERDKAGDATRMNERAWPSSYLDEPGEAAPRCE